MNWLLHRVLAIWVRYRVLPEDIPARLQSRAAAVCYVLERRSITDLAILQRACVRLRLPRPRKRLLGDAPTCAPPSTSAGRAASGTSGWTAVRRRSSSRCSRRSTPTPTSTSSWCPPPCYWGRAPQREASWFRLLLVENWALTSRARKFLQVLFNGRNTLVELEEPISLRSLLGDETGLSVRGRRVARSLRDSLRATSRGAHRTRPLPPAHHRHARTADARRARRRRAGNAREIAHAAHGAASGQRGMRKRSPPTTRMPSSASSSAC